MRFDMIKNRLFYRKYSCSCYGGKLGVFYDAKIRPFAGCRVAGKTSLF